ncbi:MAG: glucokinase [Nanoarchaeota archaeon]|nr:glucokinase [Nanoarchaeota archaeon]MCG2719522.1 glucokinase [Nanoarchaeota archaeon]
MNCKIVKHSKKKFSDYVLGADIGGTNTNLAIAGVNKDGYNLVLTFDYKTKSLTNLESALNNCISICNEDHNIDVTKACLGLAGPVEEDVYCKLTFIDWDVSKEKILKDTPLKKVKLINDFVALGYGLNILTKKESKKLNKVKAEPHAVKAVIGAGTGLGKTILYYDQNNDCYIPLPSEGGHIDLPFKDLKEFEFFKDLEFKIFDYHHNKEGRKLSLSDILSGRGIEQVYEVVKEKYKQSKYRNIIEKSKDKPSTISKFRKKDSACKETFDIFTRFYGRAAKNFSLMSLCFGGLYIGGGIALKNEDIFKSEIFWEEFHDSYMSHVIDKIPVFLMKQYDSGIKGALFAASKLL